MIQISRKRKVAPQGSVHLSFSGFAAGAGGHRFNLATQLGHLSTTHSVRRVARSFVVMFVDAIYAKGAPFLRFLQGRVSMLLTQPLSFRTTPLRTCSWFPPFAKNAKDGAPTVSVMSGRSKMGHPTAILISVRESLCEVS
jgi:hypothetical protein